MSKMGDKILATSTKNVSGKCHFCGKEVDGEFWCFGCDRFVCEDCEEEAPMGKHRVEDHKEKK